MAERKPGQVEEAFWNVCEARGLNKELEWYLQGGKKEGYQEYEAVLLPMQTELDRLWWAIAKSSELEGEILSERQHREYFASNVSGILSMVDQGLTVDVARDVCSFAAKALETGEKNRSRDGAMSVILVRYRNSAYHGSGGGDGEFRQPIRDPELYNALISTDIAFCNNLLDYGVTPEELFKYSSPYRGLLHNLVWQIRPEEERTPHSSDDWKRADVQRLYLGEGRQILDATHKRITSFMEKADQAGLDNDQKEAYFHLLQFYSDQITSGAFDQEELDQQFIHFAKSHPLQTYSYRERLEEMVGVAPTPEDFKYVVGLYDLVLPDNIGVSDNKYWPGNTGALNQILKSYSGHTAKGESLAKQLHDQIKEFVDTYPIQAWGVLHQKVESGQKTIKPGDTRKNIEDLLGVLESSGVDLDAIFDGDLGNGSAFEVFKEAGGSGLVAARQEVQFLVDLQASLVETKDVKLRDVINFTYAFRKFAEVGQISDDDLKLFLRGGQAFAKWREMGLTPRSLLSNWPSNRQDWWEHSVGNWERKSAHFSISGHESIDTETISSLKSALAYIEGSVKFMELIGEDGRQVLKYLDDRSIGGEGLASVAFIFIEAEKSGKLEEPVIALADIFNRIKSKSPIHLANFFEELVPTLRPFILAGVFNDNENADSLISALEKTFSKKDGMRDFCSLIKSADLASLDDILLVSQVFGIGNNSLRDEILKKLGHDLANIKPYLGIDEDLESLDLTTIRKKYFNNFPAEGFLQALITVQRICIQDKSQISELMSKFQRIYLSASKGHSRERTLEKFVEFAWKTNGVDRNEKVAHLHRLLEVGNADQFLKVTMYLSVLAKMQEFDEGVKETYLQINEAKDSEEYVKLVQEALVGSLSRVLEFEHSEVSEDEVVDLVSRWGGMIEPIVYLAAKYKVQGEEVAFVDESGNPIRVSRFERFKTIVKHEVKGTFKEFRYSHARRLLDIPEKIYKEWQKNERLELQNVPLSRKANDVANDIRSAVIQMVNNKHLSSDAPEDKKAIYEFAEGIIEDSIISKSFDHINEWNDIVGRALGEIKKYGKVVTQEYADKLKLLGIDEGDAGFETVRAYKGILELTKYIIGVGIVDADTLASGYIAWDRDNAPKIETALQQIFVVGANGSSEDGADNKNQHKLVQNDVMNLRQLISKLGMRGVIEKLVIEERDDLKTLLWIGELPARTCQSFTGKHEAGGGLERLDDLALEPMRKVVVAVVNDEQFVSARAIDNISRFGEAIGLEPTYSNFGDAFTNHIKGLIEKKAESIPGKPRTGTTQPVSWNEQFKMIYGGYFDSARGIVGGKQAQAGFTLPFYD